MITPMDQQTMIERKPKNHMHGFSREDVKTLLRLWPDHSLVEISEKMGRTIGSVQRLANLIREKTGYQLAYKSTSATSEENLKDIVAEFTAEEVDNQVQL